MLNVGGRRGHRLLAERARRRWWAWSPTSVANGVYRNWELS